MKAANEGHFDPVSADIAFHATILEISHNRFFHQLTPIIETALRFSIRLTNKVKGTLARLRRATKRSIGRSATATPRRHSSACRELIKEALMLVIKTDKAQNRRPGFRFSRSHRYPHARISARHRPSVDA